MDLRELRLERLPGLPDPFGIEGRPGLNLILGPNGSGKSSLTRAALSLLFGDSRLDAHCTAIWQQDETVWHAARSGRSALTWQKDGQPHAPPPLPQTDQAAAFRLGLLDILKLSVDDGDRGLARAIRSQMAGGYDLGTLIDEVDISGREGQKEARALESARQHLRDLQREARSLRHQEEELTELERQLAAARAAARRAEILRLARKARQEEQAADAAQTRLADDFPAAMRHLQKDDQRTLVSLRTRQRDDAADRAETMRAIDDAEASLRAAGLPDGGPSDVALETATQRLEEARRLAAELDRAGAAADAAETVLAEARRALGPWGGSIEGEVLGREELGRAAREVKALLEAAAERDGLARLLALPPLQEPDEPPPSAQTLAAGRQALVSWLLAAPGRRVGWPALLAGLALVALGAILRPWSAADAPFEWAVLAAGLLALAAGLAPLLPSRRAGAARRAFAATGLREPPTWTGQDVAGRIETLAEEQARSLLDQLRRRLHEDLAVSHEQASRRAGAEDPTLRLDAAELLRRNADCAGALAGRDSALAARDRLAVSLRETLAEAGRPIAGWLHETPADVGSLAAAIKDLTRRRDTHARAEASRRQARDRLAGLDGRDAETAAEIEALLARLGLPPAPESDDLVRAYDARLASFCQRRDTALDLAARARVAREELDRFEDQDGGLAHEALAWPTDSLDVELSTAETTAARQTELHDRIVRIQERLDQARRDTTRDAALLAHDRAREDLTAVRDRVRGNALRRLLLDRVREQHNLNSEPPVLQRARAIFARITAGRYELRVGDAGDAGFFALDTTTRQGLALAQLSDGTRAQLLLAARLAYIQEAERGVTVPLFLDESLTASDPGRFAAVGGSVLDLIEQEGRQVFYLTCDPADVAAWQELLAARGLPPAPVVDLARIRGLAAAAPAERLRLPVREPAPAPTPGEDPADYAARLGGVAGLDRFAPPDAAHLLHLLRDDLALLHRLLAGRVERVGQLGPCAPALLAAGLLTPAQRDALDARARALAAFLEAAAVGHGRPVPPGALTAADLSKSSKLPQIEDLLARQDIGGDARRLVAALERGDIPRLQQRTQDEVLCWLRDQGHLVDDAPLAGDAVRQRVLRAAEADLAAGRLDLPVLNGLIDAWLRATAAGPAG